MDREELDNICEKGILGLVLAVLFFSPLATGSVRPQDFLVVQWLAVGIVAVWLVRFFINPKHRLLWIPLSWPVLGFVIYAVIRYATADVEFLARQELIRILVYAVLFYAVVNNLHRQETTQVVGLMLIFLAMSLSLYAVYQFLAATDNVWGLFGEFIKPDGYKKRGSGTFICPNNLAGYLEMILPLALAFTLTGRFEPLQKIFLGYASLAIFAGLSVTVSRGGWVAAGVSLIALFLYLVRQRDYWKRALVVVAVLAGIFTFFFLKAEMPPNRTERFDRAFEVEDVRFRLWQPATDMWKDHFWFGVGPAHFDYRFRQYRPELAELQNRPDRVHNDYLNTLVDFGLVGGLLVLGCWVVFYWQVMRSWKFVQRSRNDLAAKRSNKSAFVLGGSIGLVAILVHSLFDFNMHIPANAILAVTIMGLVAAHYRFATERHWHTVRWGLRIPLTAALVLALGFLGWRSWTRTTEARWLTKASATGLPVDQQVAFLKRALAAEPNNFDTAYQLGEVLRLKSWQGQEGFRETALEAIEWFKRAAALNPYDPYPLLGAGMCFDWIGDHKSAAEFFKNAQKTDPHSFNVYAHLGWHHFQTEEYETARNWFERSLALASDEKRNPIPHSYLRILEERRSSRPQ